MKQKKTICQSEMYPNKKESTKKLILFKHLYKKVAVSNEERNGQAHRSPLKAFKWSIFESLSKQEVTEPFSTISFAEFSEKKEKKDIPLDRSIKDLVTDIEGNNIHMQTQIYVKRSSIQFYVDSSITCQLRFRIMYFVLHWDKSKAFHILLH